MERIEIIGNLVRDPEVRPAGDRYVCGFDVAVNRRIGEREETKYYSISVWGKLGEQCAKYLAKGRKVFVNGRPDARGWVNNAGTACAGISITANDVVFLSGARTEQTAPAKPADANGFTEVDDDELPY